MRIELPLPAWNESSLRADDDAHTLTVEMSPATEWTGWHWAGEPSPTLRAQVEAQPLVTVTITL